MHLTAPCASIPEWTIAQSIRMLRFSQEFQPWAVDVYPIHADFCA